LASELFLRISTYHLIEGTLFYTQIDAEKRA
jgi:hypothetical protein